MLSISAQNPQLEWALHNTSHVSLDLNIFLTGEHLSNFCEKLRIAYFDSDNSNVNDRH